MSAKIIKGEDISLKITLRDKDKNPYDLTGKTVTIKSKIAGTLTTFSDDVDVTEPLKGKLSLELSDTITETLTAGTDAKPAYFDMDVYVVEGTVTRIVKLRSQVTVEDRQR